MSNMKIQNINENYLSKSVTFATAVNNWEQKIRNSKLASSTVKTYKNIVDKKLMPKLGQYNISDISKHDCEKLINDFRKQSLSEVYLQMIWRVFSLIMKNAYEENLISKKFDLAFPATINSQISQSKLENAIHKNDASALMSVLLHEKILINKLIALRKIDVNENDCSLTLRRRAFVSGNSFMFKDESDFKTVKISNESLRIILCEISKHNALEKKIPRLL